MTALRISAANGRVRFGVHLQPRAARNEIAGVHGDALRIRVTAPPVEGAANAALVEFLADAFAVPRRSVKILAGETSRSKVVEIEGITERAVHDLAATRTR